MSQSTHEAIGGNAEEASATVISCEECLDISLAQDLCKRLQQALEAKRPVVLDAGGVTRADTAVLQLLCAFFQDVRASGMEVQWQQSSPALQNSARLLGLDACLSLPMD
jgi:anti-anti-sigma regulatory factor